MSKKQTILSRPKDKTFESFKAWFGELCEKLGAKQTLSENELKEGWIRFWKKRGKKVEK